MLQHEARGTNTWPLKAPWPGGSNRATSADADKLAYAHARPPYAPTYGEAEYVPNHLPLGMSMSEPEGFTSATHWQAP